MLRFHRRPASIQILVLFLAIVLPSMVGAENAPVDLSVHEVVAEYVGTQAHLLEAGVVQPLSLAAADLDEDGIPDLVVGYGDGETGLVAVHFGNLDSIYPRPGEELGSAFLPVARVFAASSRASFVGTGDFDADGHFDVVTARTGGTVLELHRGDGSGRLAPAEAIDLGGRLTAMAVGEVNRREGLADIVVGVDGPSGPKILVFESPVGALRGVPETIDAFETVTAIELGNFDEDFFRDIVAVTESYQITVVGRDRRLSLGTKQRAAVREAVVSVQPASSMTKRVELAINAEIDGEIVAHLSMRLNRDAFPDSVVITDESPVPIVVKTLSRAIFTVDSTADDSDFDTGDGICDTDDSVGDGPCTVRAAIEQANASAGADVIEFDIAGPGPHVIQPASRIPFITESVTVDGTTEPDYVDTPVVEVDGLLAGTPGDLSGFQVESAGNTTIRGLSIYRFDVNAIQLRFVGGNVVEGCILGTNGAGALGLGNGGSGLDIWTCSGNTIGGTVPEARNTASGNGGGIAFAAGSLNNSIQGNFVGIDPAGTTAIPNVTGIYARDPNNTIGGVTAGAGNVVSGNFLATNQGAGIFVSGNSVVDLIIHGNLIGTDVTGTLALGNEGEGVRIKFSDGITVGGTSPAMRNIISGNYYGIVTESTADDALIQGNYIGTDITGMIDLGNVVGVACAVGDRCTVGGAEPGAGNLVSGNLYGVSVATSNNIVQGNLVGTDATGVGPIPNENHGVLIGGSSNLVGGTDPSEANIIAFNDGHGVRVYPGTGHSILGNSIHSNTGVNSNQIPGNGFGIELGYEDEIAVNDPGDADTGVNNLQNYPVLTAVTGGGTTVDGSLNSTPSTQFDLEFFANTTCDASGYGEGETFLGSDTVTTDGSGDIVFSSAVVTPVPIGSYVTATATAPDGSTSEFSACFQYTANADLGIIKDDGVTEVLPGGQVTYVIVATNAGPDDLPGTRVSDEFSDVLSCSWTCVSAGGATCTSGPSTEDIDDIINLPVGGTATYTAVCDVEHTAIGFVENTADVIAPTGANDPNMGNNEATDTDAVTGIDYGDAPDPSFPTWWDSDGARHVLGGGLYLGLSVDADADGQPTPAADGDDADGTDDEDGVVFASVAVTGYTANIVVTASSAGLLNAWVDFNADGDWLDASEQVFTDQALTAGANALGIAVPATASTGPTYARFRVDTAGGLAPDGLALDGEVEDHAIEIRSSTLDIRRTGQTTSYAAGDDGGFQMGTPWPVPRFVDNADGTVSDQLTGLMWTQDNVNPGPAPCNPGVTRDWFLSLSYVDCLNTNSYLGHNDWRMPNVVELVSLIHFQETDLRPWWSSQGFTSTTILRWWSSTTTPSGLSQSSTMTGFGTLSGFNKAGVSGTAVWPVRGGPDGGATRLPATGQARCWDASYAEVPCAGTGQDGDHRAGAAWPSPRFEVAGDCVTDRLTGLTWTKDGNPIGFRSWRDAIEDTLALSLCGFDDWRLPTVLELRSLMHHDKRTDPVPGSLFEWWESQGFVNVTTQPVWSGTTYSNFIDSAWTMQSNYTKDIDDSVVVWPVRGNVQTDTADLAVVMMDSSDPVNQGENVIYTIDVSNLGPNTANEVTITNTIPTGSTYVSATGTGWTCGEDSGVVTCTDTSVAPGPAALVDIEITAPMVAGPITNTAFVDSLQSDPVAENNFATESTNVSDIDYGDAPDPTYPTLAASDGARHTLGSGLFLGASVDSEADGQPTALADGDDIAGIDDEDGVVFTSGIGAGLDAFLDVTASGTGLLNAWIDFNADGDWADAGEQILVDQALAAGANPLTFPVPVAATLGNTFARFRFDSTGGLSYDGLAPDGEVEDYMVEIVEGPDLEIDMVASSNPTASGHPLSYTITVTNNGPLPATSVTVTDTLPGELIFVSSTPGSPDCTFSIDTLTCDLGTMAPTDTAQITIETTLDHPVWGTVSNSSSVAATELDPLPANNTAAVDTNIALFVDGFESGDLTAWD